MNRIKQTCLLHKADCSIYCGTDDKNYVFYRVNPERSPYSEKVTHSLCLLVPTGGIEHLAVLAPTRRKNLLMGAWVLGPNDGEGFTWEFVDGDDAVITAGLPPVKDRK